MSAEGNILQECSVPTCVDLGPEAVASRIGQVIAQLSDGEAAIGGVGVGCPGTVDDASGIVRFAANLNFINFDLRSALRAYTALPIHLGNDANAAALGEALFGCGKGAESTIVVTLGTGVGGGVVLGGKLLTGYTGAASERGHMVIAENGEDCTGGSRGTSHERTARDGSVHARILLEFGNGSRTSSRKRTSTRSEPLANQSAPLGSTPPLYLPGSIKCT